MFTVLFSWTKYSIPDDGVWPTMQRNIGISAKAPQNQNINIIVLKTKAKIHKENKIWYGRWTWNYMIYWYTHLKQNRQLTENNQIWVKAPNWGFQIPKGPHILNGHGSVYQKVKFYCPLEGRIHKFKGTKRICSLGN